MACRWPQEESEGLRYTPVPESVISAQAQERAAHRITNVAVKLALRSAATLHTFVQARGHTSRNDIQLQASNRLWTAPCGSNAISRCMPSYRRFLP